MEQRLVALVLNGMKPAKPVKKATNILFIISVCLIGAVQILFAERYRNFRKVFHYQQACFEVLVDKGFIYNKD